MITPCLFTFPSVFSLFLPPPSSFYCSSQFSPVQLKVIEGILADFVTEYTQRRLIFLQRLQVTIQDFVWKHMDKVQQQIQLINAVGRKVRSVNDCVDNDNCCNQCLTFFLSLILFCAYLWLSFPFLPLLSPSDRVRAGAALCLNGDTVPLVHTAASAPLHADHHLRGPVQPRQAHHHRARPRPRRTYQGCGRFIALLYCRSSGLLLRKLTFSAFFLCYFMSR